MSRTRKPRPGNPSVAIAYQRVSTDRQDLSEPAQRRAIEGWAEANDVTVIGWFFDKGVSGSSEIESRPELIAALAELKVRQAGVLVVARRDRLARDTLVAQLIERAAGRVGAVVASADGVGNGGDPASRMLRSILDAVAEYERQVIRGRIRAALAVKKGRRERVGSVPYGWHLADDDVRLLPVEAEQAVVQQARQLRQEGATFRAIAAELGQRGHVSRTGKMFDPTQVRRMVLAAA